MAEREDRTGKSQGLRVAAGLAVAAVGASIAYDRYRASGGGSAEGPKGDGASEFEVGRGERQGPVAAPSLESGYEVEDTDVRRLAIIMGVSIAIMIVGVAAVFHMYAGFDRHFAAASIGMTAEQRAPIVPPLPHLQAFPYRDIDAIVMAQKQRIESFGWDDSAHTQAHIPIERAMRQVVGRSLDAGAPADAAGPAGTTVSMPTLPDYNAAISQNKPANRMQGEGRAGAVAPSYRPSPDAKP